MLYPRKYLDGLAHLPEIEQEEVLFPNINNRETMTGEYIFQYLKENDGRKISITELLSYLTDWPYELYISDNAVRRYANTLAKYLNSVERCDDEGTYLYFYNGSKELFNKDDTEISENDCNKRDALLPVCIHEYLSQYKGESYSARELHSLFTAAPYNFDVEVRAFKRVADTLCTYEHYCHKVNNGRNSYYVVMDRIPDDLGTDADINTADSVDDQISKI